MTRPARPGSFARMRGAGRSPPGVSASEILWSFAGSLCGIALVGLLHALLLDAADLPLVVGSFGASAVLVYGAIKSPLAQPRNLIGGHVLSALIGVSVHLALPRPEWLAGALAVATAIAVMHATRTLHPPGGATALIAVIGGPKVHALGYVYALFPVGAGALILLAVGLAVNNIPETRRYPEFWW